MWVWLGDCWGEGHSNADKVLEGLDGRTVELGEWQAVASGSFLELLGRDLTGLQDANDLFRGLLDFHVKCGDPSLGGCGARHVILRSCGAASGFFSWCEVEAVGLEPGLGSFQIVGGGFEGS